MCVTLGERMFPKDHLNVKGFSLTGHTYATNFIEIGLLWGYPLTS